MAASSNASLAPITGTCWSMEILPRPMMAILRLGMFGTSSKLVRGWGTYPRGRMITSPGPGGLPSSTERPHQAPGHQIPPVHQHEEHELEGQGDHHGWQHHHAHGHEDRGHHHVDDEEGDKQQE